MSCGRFIFPRTGFLGGGLVYGLWFIIMVQGFFFFFKSIFSSARVRARARVVVSFCRDSELGGKNEDRI